MLLYIILTTPPGENFIKRILEDKISESAGLPVSIEKLETNLFSRLRLHAIAFDSPGQDKDSLPLLTIENIDCHYSLWGLPFKKLTVNSILIDDVMLRIHRDSLGKFGITVLDSILAAEPAAEESETTESSYDIDLGGIELQSLSAEYTDDSLGLFSMLDNLNVRIKMIEKSEYDYSLSADSIHAVYDSIPLTARVISLDGRFSDSTLQISSLKSFIDSLNLTGSGSIPFDTTGAYNLNFAVSGNPESIVDRIASRYGLTSPDISDGFNLTGKVGGVFQSPDMSADIIIPAIKIDRTEIESGSIAFHSRGDSLNLDSMRLRLFTGTVNISGAVVLDSVPVVSLNLDFNHLDIPAVWSAVYGEATSNTGILSGSAELSGEGYDIEDWAVKSDFRAGGLTYEETSLPDMKGLAVLSGGEASVSIGDNNIDIKAQGRIRDDNISGTFEAIIPDIEPVAALFNFPELGGSISGKGSLGGTTASPSASADIYISQMHYRNFPLDTLQAHVEYRDSLLNIKQMSFAGKIDSIDPAAPPFDIDSLTGSLEYNGTLKGTMDAPTGEMEITLHNAGYGAYNIDSAEFIVSVNGGDLRLREGNIYKDLLLITPTGNINIDQMKGALSVDLYTISLNPDDVWFSSGIINAAFDIADSGNMSIDLSSREFNLKYFKDFIPNNILSGGSLDFALNFRGNLDEPRVSCSAVISKPEIGQALLDSVSVRAEFAEDVLLLSMLNVYGDSQSLTGNVMIELSPDSSGYNIDSIDRTAGAMRMNNFDLSILGPLMDGSAELAGFSSLDLTWNGTLADPNLAGWLELHDGYYRQSAVTEPVQNVYVKAAVKDSILNIENARGTILAKDFTVGGELILSRSQDVKTDFVIGFADLGKLSMKGRLTADSIDLNLITESIDLSILKPFLTATKEIGGKLKAEMSIRGRIEDPEINGFLDVRGILFWPVEMPTPLKDGVIYARFNRDKVFIDTLFLIPGRGTMAGNGNFTHDMGEISDIDMKFSIDTVFIDSPDEYILNVRSGRFTYKRGGDYFLFDGDLEMGESRLTADFRLQSILPWARSVEQTRYELPPILENTKLNVRIRESDNLWIDNNLARMRLRTELGIIGSPGLPNFTGRVSVEEGYFMYLDRKFQIKEGTVYFFDPYTFNPEINFSAEATVKSYQAMEATSYLITLSAKGLLNELAVDITSDPLLDKTDIVALLTLGATRSQLTGKDADSKGALTERAQMLTSQKISGFISRKIGTVFGLDEVSVQGNLFSMNHSAGPQLLASKKITDRAKLTYSTTVGKSNDQNIRLDYQLTRRFFLEGQTDRLGRSALDLKYKLRFR